VSSVIVVAIYGAIPAALLVLLFAEKLGPMLGLFTKDEVKREVRRSQELSQGLSLSFTEDAETMEWLNFLVSKMWPHISDYVAKMIRGYETLIHSYVPLPGIHFSACTLGKQAIKLGPVEHKSVKGIYDGEWSEDNGVELTIGLSYNSDVDIVLSTPIASVGIADLKINGVLRLKFRPLVSASPFIGGMEMFFVSSPQVSLNFKGIANVAECPGVQGKVKNMIDDIIANLMVLPKRMAFKISGDAGVDLATLKNPIPSGVLRIKVVKATNLEGKDFSLMSAKTSDPYAEVRMGADFLRTPVVKANCNPEWTEDNTLECFYYSDEQCMQFDLFDHDRLKVGSTDRLGSMNKVPLSKLLKEAGKGPVSFPLEAHDASDSKPPEGSMLFLEVSSFNQSHALDGDEVEGVNKYSLAFKIDECKGLPEDGLGAPYTVRLTVKDSDLTVSSAAGYAKAARGTASTKSLNAIRKLKEKGMKVSDMAEIMDLPEDTISEILDQGFKHEAGTTEAAKEDEAMLKTMAAGYDKRMKSCNPCFETVLRLAVPSRFLKAKVELISDPKAKDGPKGEVVAQFELDVGASHLQEGPFKLLSADGKPLSDTATLEGSIKVYRFVK